MKGNSLKALVLSSLLMGAPVCAAYEFVSPAYVEAAAAEITVEVDKNVGQITKKGSVTVYPTIKEALTALEKENAAKSTLRLAPGIYREKIQINVPNLTLVGQNAANTTIVWDDAEGTPLRPGDTNGTKKTYTMECGTVKVTKAAANFQAVNITFENDFPTEEARVDKRVGGSVQAFAITVEADKSSFYNCRFIGRQDTLYANAGRQYYKDCYIEGDVDFIFGQSPASVFETCEIKSLNRAVKEDGKEHSTGYIAAPSTLKGDKGYLFYKCHLTGNVADPHYVFLGRVWHPTSEKRPVQGGICYRECQIDVKVKQNGWEVWKWDKKDANGKVMLDEKGNKIKIVFPVENELLFEYKNTGKYALKGGNRRQLSDAEAVNYTPEKFLGDWKPAKRV